MDTPPDLRAVAPTNEPISRCVQPGGLDAPGQGDVLDASHAGRRVFPVPGGGVGRGQEGAGGNHLDGCLNSESLQEAFQALPEPWRQILWHMDLNHAPAYEAARILGLSLPAVKALHRRVSRTPPSIVETARPPRLRDSPDSAGSPGQRT